MEVGHGMKFSARPCTSMQVSRDFLREAETCQRKFISASGSRVCRGDTEKGRTAFAATKPASAAIYLFDSGAHSKPEEFFN